MESISSSETSVSFVLIGSPGSGKSATANTILDNNCWKTAFQSIKVTNDLQVANIKRNNIDLTVIDTPGFLSVQEFQELNIKLESRNMKNLMYGITLKIGRVPFTEIAMLSELFENTQYSKYLKNKAVLIFTNKDELADIEDDTGLQEQVYFDTRFDNWLSNSTSIKHLIDSHHLCYSVISNTLDKEKRHEESNKLIQKLKEAFERRLKNDTQYSCLIERKETLCLTVDEIKDITDIVRKKRRRCCPCSIRQIGNTEEPAELIHKTLQNKGSTITKEQVKKTFDLEDSKCVII